MYEPSAGFYSAVIKAQARRLVWHGTLTDTDGTDHTFTADNIAANSGTITQAVASNTDIELGTVYASQLDIGLYIDDIGVNRAKIYGGKITLSCTASTGDGLTSGEVPVGVFNITEATQNGEVCTITAYDNMINFDREYLGVSGIATPFNWASNFCAKCGVTFGMTEAQVLALPNGGISLTLIWNDDIETYRDALSHLAAAVGSVATINRSGALVFIPLKAGSPVTTVQTRDRFGSDIAHNTFEPHTIYVTNEETGEITSATSGAGNANFDLGANVFLQAEGRIRDEMWEFIATRSVRIMLENIITPLSTFVSVPIQAEVPCDPCLDLLDCITLTGGQAALGGTTVRITSIVTTLGGSTTIECAGANTAEATTGTERNASKSGGTQDLLMWQSTDMNSAELVIDFTGSTWGDFSGNTWEDLSGTPWGELGGLDILVAETTLTAIKDWAKGQLSFTVNYTLDVDAVVTYKVFIDSVEEWVLEEEQQAGKIVKTITTPVSLWSNTETAHTFQITMKGEPTGS